MVKKKKKKAFEGTVPSSLYLEVDVVSLFRATPFNTTDWGNKFKECGGRDKSWSDERTRHRQERQKKKKKKSGRCQLTG